MANRKRGEFELEQDGATFRGVLDFNALAEFEDRTGENALEILADGAGLKVTHMRTLMWAGLRQFHPDITLQQAGSLLSENQHKLGEALASAFPDDEPDGGDEPAPANRAEKRKRAAAARKST